MIAPNEKTRHRLVRACIALTDRNAALNARLEALRHLCQGHEPEEWIAHMSRENRELREERSRHVYDTVA